MYLSKKQIWALSVAQVTLENKNSGGLTEEQAKAYDIIGDMVQSAINEKESRPKSR